MRESYPTFYPMYFRDILQLGSLDDSMAVVNLEKFNTDPEWTFAQSQIDSVFRNNDELRNGFRSAFGRYKSVFPKRSTPDIYIMNSGFNYGIYPIPQLSVLGIGAEFYLGKENTMIKRLPNELFPAYMREQMVPEQLLPNALKGWIILNHNDSENRKDLLGLIISYGKIMYALHLCIPDIPEHRHFAYTASQLAWCQENEEQIWKVLVEQDILFSNDKDVLMDWVGRGPFTQGFSEESPAELAYFMGKQMVQDFMKENPEVSVEQLMEVPAETVLKDYTPD
ncbi:MAG: hypothetical protein HKO93_00355 [Flavobacteriales bacterium]|nr:hypothetical protein [Flavobacteriales bacterium]